MKNTGIFLSILAFFLLSCEEMMDVSFSSNVNKKLVVEGVFTTDTTAHQVMLSWTGDYFARDTQNMETDAVVSITDGEKTMILTENINEPGIYRTDSNVYGETGKTYTLNIKLSDSSKYSATESISPLPEIDSITQSGNYNHMEYSTEKYGYGYDIIYFGPEPEGVGDYYLWSLYINDVLYTDTIFETVFADDEFIDGNYIRDIELFFIKEEEIPGDSAVIRLEMYSISEEYYLFLIGLMLETKWRGSPWDGPPANVPSNISNGARGYFRTSDKKTATMILYKTERIN
jgi:hypothetical protein